jgi:hypothetical protein
LRAVGDAAATNPLSCGNLATSGGFRQSELVAGRYLAGLFSVRFRQPGSFSLRSTTAVAASHDPESMRATPDRSNDGYDLGADDIRCEVTNVSGSAPTRLQTLPVQKNGPRAQASTRSEFGPFIAIVA